MWAKEAEEKSKEVDAIADSAAKLIEEASRELGMAREASKCAKTKADEVNAILSAMNWQGDEWVVNKDDVPVDEASFRYSDYVSYAKDKILATLSGLGLYQNIN